MLSALRRRGLETVEKLRPATKAPSAPYALRTRARQLVGNLTVTVDGEVWAGYRCDYARWDFLGTERQQAVLDANRDVWASVVGHRVLERVMNRPHNVTRWMANLDARTPHPVESHQCDVTKWTRQQLLDGACGCETWNRHMVRQQRRISQAGLDDKFVVRYFRIGRIDPKINVVAALHALRAAGTRPAAEELRTVLRDEKVLRDSVRAWPWNASPLTEREQRIVRMRSLAPGIPLSLDASSVWDEPMVYDQLAAETGSARWHEDVLDVQTRIVGLRNGHAIERAVSVVTLLSAGPITYPESGLEPWQVYPERATDPEGKSFALEMALVGRIATGEELQKAAEYNLNRAIHTQRQYENWDNEIPPTDVTEGIARALAVRDEVFKGEDRVAARFLGSVNAVLWGEDVVDTTTGKLLRPAAEVLAERVESFKRLMRGNALRQQWEVAQGQAEKLQETIPGELQVTGAYQRQFDLRFLAAGLPNVSASLGDGAGPYMGYTRGGARRPVQFDTHYTTEGRKALGRKANLWLVVGSLGSGKSVWMMLTAYNAARRGIRCVYSDPSGLGPAQMAAMPELADVSVVRNMTSGHRGELNPPSLIRMPVRGEFEEEDSEGYLEAIMATRKLIRSTVIDVVWMQMPEDIWQTHGAKAVLREQVNAIEWSTDSDLWPLVARLETFGGEVGVAMGAVMRENAQDRRLKVMYAEEGTGGDFTAARSASGKRPVLTVITTPGLVSAAPGVPRADWNDDEMASPPLRHLAALLTSRELFDKPMKQRACGFFDEAHHYKDHGSGRAMMTTLGRDHSKWNIHGQIASQDLDGAMVGDLRNFLAGAIVGQMKNIEHAEQLLPVLQIEDKRYARTLLDLSQDTPGEFVMLDADRRVGAIRADTAYHPEFEAAAFTNPDPEGSDAWGTEAVIS